MLTGEQPPAVVITEDSGKWDLRSCRSRQGSAPPVAVVLSLHPRPQASYLPAEGAGFAVLRLPVDPEKLVATIRHALRSRPPAR